MQEACATCGKTALLQEKVHIDFIDGHYVGTIYGHELSMLMFSSLDEADNAKIQMKQLPPEYFVKPYQTIEQDGKYYLFVEKFEKLLPSATNVINIVRDIINLAVDLDLSAQVHGNLSIDKFVVVGERVKSYAIPSPSGRGSVIDQAKQVYDVVRKLMMDCKLIDGTNVILWTKQTIVPCSFLELLSKAYTTVDLESLLVHPFLLSIPQQRQYHSSAMLIMGVVDRCREHRKQFNKLHKKRLNYEWQKKLDPTSLQLKDVALVNVFKHKKDENDNGYGETAFDMHVFIRNVFNHPNTDDSTLDIAFKGLDEIHSHIEHLFPDYLPELHDYMHDTALNGQLRRRKTMLELLKDSQESIEIDKQLYIIPLLKTCKILAFVLAKMKAECKKMKGCPLEKLREQLLEFVWEVEYLAEAKGWQKISDIEGAHLSSVTRLSSSIGSFITCLKRICPGGNLATGMETERAVICSLRSLALGRKQLNQINKQIRNLNLPNKNRVIRILGGDAMTSKEMKDCFDALYQVADSRDVWIRSFLS